MGSTNCTNEACCGTTSSEWKNGWSLKSGGFAKLCYNCGLVYENSMFCETFHLEESGWRECKICGKRIHCGCIASRHLHECMDFGGIWCTNCAKRLEVHPVQPSLEVHPMQPSLEVLPMQPSLEVLPVQPSLEVLPMQPSLEVLPVQPSLEVLPLQPSLEVLPMQPSLEVLPMQPSLEDHPGQPSLEVHPGQQSLEVHPVQPSLEVHPVQPSLEVHPVQPSLEVHPVQPSIQIPSEIPNGTLITNGIQDIRPVVPENQIDGDKFSTERLLQLTKVIGANNASSPFEKFKQDDPVLKTRLNRKHFITLPEQFSVPSFLKPEHCRPKEGVKGMYDSLTQPSINFTLTNSLGSSGTGVPFPSGIVEGSSGQSQGSLQPGQRERHILPKPTKLNSTAASESNKGAVSQARVARPPAEGRGRNQLLPRYWPRITDQELQQLSGDLKSVIVPLFEKILSASDAGRIGRLVLPKACAEAYFPPINQSEGIPIRIQDIKGKEWTFQFRFWPNNNSRMYVLEGVTPCIQNMQVQAGDTVTFSRIDPGGQLVIGCRKATNNGDGLDSHTTGDSAGETSFSGATNGGRTSDDSLQKHVLMSEKKKARNIKNKRLLMHTDDVMELRVTWEEAQELLRPSPTSKPSVVMIEDHEFEEFEEPPIFGKRTVFTSRPSGEKEQLAQCDSCSKWRRLPVNALLSAKWTCLDNIWDSKRCSCSAPEDINPKDLENLHIVYKDCKKRRISSDTRVSKEGEPTGLDALATAAVLGDTLPDVPESSVGATTRHPRHRVGCTCIVCIQPPSGKGKHEPTCKCNVCLTVRRRFKTLMMRKKKRQSEREAELTQARDKAALDKVGETAEDSLLHINPPENDTSRNDNGSHADLDKASEGQQLDLNCFPHRDDGARMNLATLMNAATLMPDVHPGQDGLPSTESSLHTVAGSEGKPVAEQDLVLGDQAGQAGECADM